MAKKRKRRKVKTAQKVLRALVIAVIASCAITYIVGINSLKGRFLPNTYVNGVFYGDMTPEEAEAKFESSYAGRTLLLKERGGAEEVIGYDDIGYEVSTGQTFKDLVDNQNYFAWPVTYINKTRLLTSEGFSYSKSKLDEALSALAAVSGDGVTPPTDAAIVKTDTGFILAEETYGNEIIYDRLFDAVTEAVNRGDTELDLESADVYKKPSIYSDNEALNASFAAVDKVQNTVITLAMEGGVYVTVSKDVFLPWLEYSDGTLRISDVSVNEYTRALADRYDTYLHKRSFVTHAGDTVEVGGGNYDNYGYIMNREKSAAIIRDAIMSGVDQTVALEWDQYARTRDESGSDFGNTYIEVSLDEQHMWYYMDGSLVLDTAVVTGTATPSRATPTGCFSILQKLQDHTMQGSYGESFANYVMAIMTNGICIHDASWRDEYGGDIWLYDGSHGCINTPYSKVKALYENVDYGTPVIIYDRDNTVPHVHNETYTGGEHESADDEDYDYDEEYEYDEYYDEDDEDYYSAEETEVYSD